MLVPFQMVMGFFMLDYALRFGYGVLLHWQIYIPVIVTILSILRFSGLALVILILLMFVHRLGKFEVRRISIPSDYAVLGLLLAVASLASFNNFVAPTPLEYIGKWIVGLVTLDPAPIGDLAFSLNILALQIMLIFFPFSKMRDPFGHLLSRMFTVKEELLNPKGVVVK
jgi:nitrate reductase gamma subunit